MNSLWGESHKLAGHSLSARDRTPYPPDHLAIQIEACVNQARPGRPVQSRMPWVWVSNDHVRNKHNIGQTSEKIGPTRTWITSQASHVAP